MTMKRELHTIHSDALGRDMSMIVYGEKGYPIVAFQTQDHTCESFEQDGLLEPLAEYIDGGRIQLFSVDNADEKSWSDLAGDKTERAQRQEDYFRFVTDELLPQVHKLNGSELRPLAMGCSMGATHAALAALRRPDLFQGCLSLSGVYRASYFFGDWSNPTLYDNDIVSFLPNMPLNHPYVELYRHRSLLFCVGQGAFEDGQDDVRAIDHELDRLGVPHWCDFWGYDVNHDPYWWKKQLRYFMPLMLEDIEKELASEGVDVAARAKAGAKPAAAKPAAKVDDKPAVKPAAAKKTAPKAAAKPQAKTTAKASEKPAAKAAAAAKAPAKAAAATKASAKAAEKTAVTKAAPKATATKAEAKPAAKAEVKAEPATKAAAKPAAKATAKAAAKTEPKAEPTAKATAKPATKAAEKTAPKTAAKATAKAEPKATKTAASAKAEPAKPAARATTATKPVSPKPASKAATETKATSPKPAAKIDATPAIKATPAEAVAAKPTASKTVAAKPAATKSTAAKSSAGKASAKGGATRAKTVRSSRKKK